MLWKVKNRFWNCLLFEIKWFFWRNCYMFVQYWFLKFDIDIDQGPQASKHLSKTPLAGNLLRHIFYLSSMSYMFLGLPLFPWRHTGWPTQEIWVKRVPDNRRKGNYSTQYIELLYLGKNPHIFFSSFRLETTGVGVGIYKKDKSLQ